MLNININYPYPLIREEADDYQTTVFSGNFSVNLMPDSYIIHPAFEVNNSEIQSLISAGTLTYAIEVLCTETWYRRLFKIQGNNSVKLDTKAIHGRVELIPCIIAAKHISDFSVSDFAEEYQGLSFEVNPGDVIGIGGKRVFDAFYQNDIIRNGSSIIKIGGSDKVKEISYNLESNIIEITLPSEQHERYLECGCIKAKHKPLNAVLTVPVLVEAICIIADDETEQTSGSMSGYAWYKTIVANLKRYAENDETKYRNLLNNPFTAAEILMGNNYADALKFLSQIE